MRKLLYSLPVVAISAALLCTWNTGQTEKIAVAAPKEKDDSCGCANHTEAKSDAPITTSQSVEVSSQPFEEFNQWLAVWKDADDAGREKLLHTGTLIAQARATALSQLIEENPDAALSHTLPLTAYADLPQEIASISERPVNQEVGIRVLPSCSGEQHAGTYIDYSVERDGTQNTEKAYTSTSHPATLSKTRTPVMAYRLGGKSLLAPSPLYQLQPEEITNDAITYIDPVNGETAQPHLRAIIDGHTLGFASQKNITALRDALTTAAESLSPKSMEYTLDALSNNESLEPATIVRVAAMMANSWTTGAKSILIIRVQFGDIAATSSNSWSAASANLQSALDATVEPAISSMSFGKATLTATATSGLYTIGNWAGNYASQGNPEYAILGAAKTQAVNAGYNLSNYDIVGVCFPKQDTFEWVGLASTGGPDFWLNGHTSKRVIVHELGHNYGVRHAGHWLVNGSSEPHASSGSFLTYGDIYDAMGASFADDADFNMVFKHQLNWLETSNKVDLKTASVGTHRIYRFDDKNVDLTSDRKFVINAQIASSPDIWIGYRNNATKINPYNLHNGAHIIWKNATDGGHTRLLDMTPDSQSNDHQDKKDSALAVGQSYTFPGPLKVEVLAKGGVAPHEYIDVKVTLGTPGNTAPTVSSITPVTATAFKPVTFTSNASDADGDTLTYSWNFGDNSPISSKTSSNATPSKTFTTGGTYTVSLTVGDGKGNFATHTQQVTVSNPLSSWTKLTTNTNATLNGICMANNKLFLTGDNSILRSSTDGADSWTLHSLPHACELQDVAYFNGAYLIVGRAYISNKWSSVIYRSSDLTTFTNVAPPSLSNALNSIAHSGSEVIAAGQNGTVLRSTDGISWAAQSSGTSYHLNEVDHNGNRFVIGGGSGTFSADTNSINNVAIQSTNGGTTWTSVSPVSSSYHTIFSILAHNGEFLAGETNTKIPYTTGSGANWTSSYFFSQAYVTGLTYGQNIYLATGIGLNVDFEVGFRNFLIVNDYAAVSLDGKNWAVVSSPTGQKTSPRDNTYGQGYFFIVGSNGNLWRSGLVSPYDKWTSSNIPVGSSTTLTADNDGDTLSNEMEFALGTNPAAPTANPVQLDLTGSKAKVTINKNALASSDYSYELLRSTNLKDWNTVGTTVITNTATQLQIESTSDISSSSKEFYKLVITVNSP